MKKSIIITVTAVALFAAALVTAIYFVTKEKPVEPEVTESADAGHIHTEQIVEGIEATCLGEGISDGKTCSDCGELLKAQEKISMLGHDFGSDKKCKRCGRPKPTDGLEYELIDEGTAYALCGFGNATDTDLVVADLYNGKFVTRIKDFLSTPSYDKQPLEEKMITSILLPDTLTHIDDYAFDYYMSIKSIDIPASVISMGVGIFFNCISLESITVNPKNPTFHSSENCIIETASKTLIAGCNKSVIPNDGSVTALGERALCGCKELNITTIPSSIKTIGEYALAGIRNIIDFTVPEGVTEIGHGAFAECSNMRSISLPASVTKIGRDALGIRVLDSLTVHPDNKTYTASGNCIIEKATKTLIYAARNATVPTDGSITRIGYNVFSGRRFDEEFVIPNGVTHIEDYAFERASFKSLILPESLVYIGNYAFDSVKSEIPIQLPGSIEFIGDQAFTNASIKTSVYENASYYGNDTNPYLVLFSFNQIKTSSLTVHPDTKHLYAFTKTDSPKVTSISLPEGLISIGFNSFSSFKNVSEIIIPQSVKHLTGNPFLYCSKLTKLHIPKNVESISASVFRYSGVLSEVTVSKENNYFFGIDNCIIEKATGTLIATFVGCKLPADGSIKIIAPYSLLGVYAEKELILPEGITTIEGVISDHFTNNIESIILPKSLTNIGKDAFHGFRSIKSIVIPEGTEYLAESVLAGCRLESVTLPASIKRIENWALNSCTRLRTIIFGGTVAEWKAIEKESRWNAHTVDYTIICTDGELYKNGVKPEAEK